MEKNINQQATYITEWIFEACLKGEKMKQGENLLDTAIGMNGDEVVALIFAIEEGESKVWGPTNGVETVFSNSPHDPIGRYRNYTLYDIMDEDRVLFEPFDLYMLIKVELLGDKLLFSFIRVPEIHEITVSNKNKRLIDQIETTRHSFKKNHDIRNFGLGKNVPCTFSPFESVVF